MKGLPILVAVAVGLASCNTESTSTDNSVASASTNTEAADPAKVQAIGSQDAKALLEKQEDIMILDVRTPAEYGAGHLKNAQHIDFYAADFSQRLQTLDPAKTYLVYCAVGGRSREAAHMMQQLGFTQVYDASEGFSSLKNSGIPVE